MEIDIAVLSGVLLFCILNILFYQLSNKKVLIDKRVKELYPKKTELEKADAQKRKKDKQKTRVGFGKKLSGDLEAAGILLKPQEYLLIWAATTIVPPMIFLIAGGQLISVFAVMLIGLIIPPLLVARSKRKRMKKFEMQLSDSIVLISNNLRAGFTFQQSMESVSKEMHEPIAGEFKRTLMEIQLGVPTEEAMERMVKRTNNSDLSLLVSAVLIHWKVGGNLAEVLDNIAGTIRDRLRIKGEVRIATASGKTSGLVIGLLPVFLVAILMIMNPTYIIGFFSTTIGIILIIVSILMEILGFLVIKKITDIKM